MNRIAFCVLILISFSSKAGTRSFNAQWIGTWTGTAPTKQLCSGGRDKIEIQILQTQLKPGENFKVELIADWGCFSKMTIPGFIFGNEFWAASDDRMTFVKLNLVKSNNVKGEFKFDLNGQVLEMAFKDFKKE